MYYDDNYFTLLPGESRSVALDYQGSGTLVAEPYNGIATTAAKLPAARKAEPTLRFAARGLVLNGTQKDALYQIKLLDLQGKVGAFAIHKGGVPIMIDMQNVAHGVYVIEVDTQGESILVKRFSVH